VYGISARTGQPTEQERSAQVNLRTPDVLPERSPPRPAPKRIPPRRIRQRRRRAVKVIGIVLVVLVLIAVVGVTVGYRYASSLLEGRGRQVAGTERPPPGEPTNILIVGSDSREGLSDAQLGRLRTIQVAGQRTDTMIVLHVSPKKQKAVMVSLPRDLKTLVNGRTEKINAAGAGGPDLLVRTVEETTGLNINHFVQINFAGFLKVVDAVGGVTLCNRTGKTLVDKYAGLRMKPGCQLMDGAKALAYVRARHIDDEFGRIQRQQEFMRALMAKLSSGGNLINIPKLLGIANAVSKVVETDDGFTTNEALSLARRVGDLSADRVDMRVYPSVAPGPACAGCPDYVVGRDAEARLLFDAINHDAAQLPPVGHPGGKGDASLSSIPVVVYNGGDIPGAARRAADELQATGVSASVGGNASQPTGSRTILRYPKRLTAEARLLNALLKGQAELIPAGPEGPERSLALTVGTGFQGL
jgi:LCP family protein required for cell wall assembly